MPFEVGAGLVIIGLAGSVGAVTELAGDAIAEGIAEGTAEAVVALAEPPLQPAVGDEGGHLQLQAEDSESPAPSEAAPVEGAPNEPEPGRPPAAPGDVAEASDAAESDAAESDESAEQDDSASDPEATPAEATQDTPSGDGTVPPADVPPTDAPPAEASPAESPEAAGSGPATSGTSVAPAPEGTAVSAPPALGHNTAPAAQTAPEPPAIAAQRGLQVLPTVDASADDRSDQGGEEEVAPANALPPGQIPVPSGLSVAVGTQMSFGQSTFQFGSSYARDPMVNWSLSLAPSYFFGDGTRIAANASLSQEITEANGDDDPGTVIFSDIGLTASRPLYRFEKGPMVFGALSLQLPTSTASRVETRIMSAGARVSASQPVGPVFLTLGSGFRKNFHEYTHPTRDPSADRLVTRDGLVVEEVVTGLARIGGSELAGATYFDGESNNTSMIWSNSLSAFWPATQKLGLGISYNLSHSWTYESYPLDEFSGVGASAGRGRRDSHGGTLFAIYQALEELSFGLGMSTGGPTRTADDKRIRFPFFNFEGPESNMTTFFISATYTESIPL